MLESPAGAKLAFYADEKEVASDTTFTTFADIKEPLALGLILPMHGSSKELGSGLVAKIKKDLGLQDR